MLAEETGKLVMAVIRGLPPDSQPYKTFSTGVIAVNTATADAIEFVFPQDVLDEARYKYP